MENNDFIKMQKLVFGKVLLNENKESDQELSYKKHTISVFSKDGKWYAVTFKGKESMGEVGPVDSKKEAIEKSKKEIDKKPLNESDLKGKIREIIKSTLSEKKKGKKDEKVEDVESSEEIIDTPTDVIEPTTSTETSPEVKSVQDHLQAAYNEAKALGDEKLTSQIGNTITYFTRTQVLGGEAVNENEEEVDVEDLKFQQFSEISEIIQIYSEKGLNNLDTIDNLEHLIEELK